MKVAQWKLEPVIDTDDRGRAMAELGHKPFSDLPAGPIPPRAWGWPDFLGSCCPASLVYAQAREARCGYFSARIVNADVTLEEHIP